MERRDLLKTLIGSVPILGLTQLLRGDAGSFTPISERSGEPLDRNGAKCWTQTTLARVFPNSPPGSAAPLQLATPRNATISFQLCLRNERTCSLRVRAEVAAPGEWSVQIRRVGYVPMANVNTDVPVEEIDGVGHIPGLVPDPLFPEQRAHVGPMSNASFWVTLTVPTDATTGVRDLTGRLIIEDEFRFPGWMSSAPETIELPVKVDVHPLVLKPRRDFPVTHWLSIDSIWEYYRIEPFSERFWELAEAYVANLTAHGVNVIYCPIFNNRHEILKRPAQLLKVHAVGSDAFEFDFSDVRRWIQLAKRNQAEHLEWTHFFTPAPTSGRHPQRIFERRDKLGALLWPAEISATSPTYRKFLEQFLPRFRQVLEEEEAVEMSLFHCADEPDGEEQTADYRRARALLKELAPWMKVIDAMSDPRYATEQLTDVPVPSIATAPLFTAANCPAWTYFCCGPRGGFLQRFLDTPLAKLRMAGWLFHKLNAKGFLHWGHNYWFQFCTDQILNPFADSSTGAWPGMPYGDAFVVYPGENGPIDSIRWEVFAESLQDLALLQTLNVNRDDPLLTDLKTYEVFPKSEGWIAAATQNLLQRG